MNDSSCQAVSLQAETFALIDRCIKLSKLTQGYFDITTATLKKIYQFKNKDFEFPNKNTINQALQKVGYKNIELDPIEQNIRFKKEGMKISFAAIGKGYASDIVKKIWQKNGIQHGYINASGDMNVIGSNLINQPWKVAIANPANRDEALLYVPLSNFAIATSGDYEQYFVYKNKRYSHNINPLTGLPVQGINSVSVLSPSAELSDALATAVYTMGTQKGISFINQLPHTHCIIIEEGHQIQLSRNIYFKNDHELSL